MTEQELREKINKIISDNNIEHIADALIEAGIGDISELKKHRLLLMDDGTVKQLYSGEEVEKIVKERGEYKHRAERAEKALDFLCNSTMKDYDVLVFAKDGTQVKNKVELYNYYIEQAEKELQEESKDEQMR